jgi:hypothetical protein
LEAPLHLPRRATNVPRWDDLYSIKRIAICWQEFMLAGIPASLHLNARTDRNWLRWTDFINKHPQVHSVTFEFATGAAHKARADYHVLNLIKLARNVDRRLQLFTRGGLQYLEQLDAAFDECVFFDTGSYVKTTKRRKLEWGPEEKKHWRSAKTLKSDPLDDLLLHNIRTTEAMVEYARRLRKDVSEGPTMETLLAVGFSNPKQIPLPWLQLEGCSHKRTPVPQTLTKAGRSLARSATR